MSEKQTSTTEKNASQNEKVQEKSKQNETKNIENQEPSRKSLKKRISDLRIEKKERKAEKKRQKQTKNARDEKAKKQAVQEDAVEQVNDAIEKSKRRKSRPLLTLVFALMLAGLGAAAMYQYRQFDVDDSNTIVAELEEEIESFSQERQALEAKRAAEEARYTTVELGDGTAALRLPVEWTLQPSSYPLEETVVGDDNVTITIVNSDARNSTDEFIPSVDNLWIMSGSTTVDISSQSRHCNRFDTFSNDFSDTRREHQGFTVYCDTDPEVFNIAVLRSPEAYGLEATGDYFLVSIKDVQQVSLEDIKSYIESYN